MVGTLCRIYPTKTQQELIEKTFRCCNLVYNKGLDMYNDPSTKTNYYATQTMLGELKKNPDYQFLREVDAVALQRSLWTLGGLFKRYFRKEIQRPKYRRDDDYQQQYQTASTAIRLENGRIKLPKLGLVKIRGEREMNEIVSVNVIRKATGKYYVNIYGDTKPKAPAKNPIEIPDIETLVERSMKRIRHEQKSLNRKQKGSANYEKQRIKLAKAYEKLANQRRDYELKKKVN